MQDQIKADLKDAMRARDKERVSTLRMLLSELKNAAIAKGDDLNEAESLTVLTREVKKRREAADSYRDADRTELADKEEAEAAILAEYLPAQMSEDDVRDLVRDIIARVKPESPRDMGKVMGQLMPKIKGKFDGKAASALVRTELNAALADGA